MSDSIRALCSAIQYHFKDQSLIQLALRHRSCGRPNNERLEFLGDAVLGTVIATALYQQFPQLKEGALSRLRATLVKGETLATIAHEFSLGQFITLSSGERRSGGQQRASILACTLEAIIGAIYLEAGFSKCQQVILKWFQPRLDNLLSPEAYKDAKTRLQEYLQGKGHGLPEYTLVKTTGKDHAQTFHVVCQIQELQLKTQAKASSRRKAEQLAAQNILEQLQ